MSDTRLPSPDEPAPLLIAEWFHEAYERVAKDFGYVTRPESAVPWAQVPQKNKDLMTMAVRSIYAHGYKVVPVEDTPDPGAPPCQRCGAGPPRPECRTDPASCTPHGMPARVELPSPDVFGVEGPRRSRCEECDEVHDRITVRVLVPSLGAIKELGRPPCGFRPHEPTDMTWLGQVLAEHYQDGPMTVEFDVRRVGEEEL